jgi:uncharacterized protein YdcH (DUF465 family)
MEDYDQSLVERLFDGNPRFRMLYEEHLLLEKELQKLSQKPYLSSDEEVEKKKVQKLKLAGKDEMDRILRICSNKS